MIPQDKIIKWAREVGDPECIPNEPDSEGNFYMHISELTAFANLVAQYQKEQDEWVCLNNPMSRGIDCAAAIRSQE